jgi:hypothetical protein
MISLASEDEKSAKKSYKPLGNKESRWAYHPSCHGNYRLVGLSFVVLMHFCMNRVQIEDSSQKCTATSSSSPISTLLNHTKFGQTQNGATAP